jgi:hypothetical protein
MNGQTASVTFPVLRTLTKIAAMASVIVAGMALPAGAAIAVSGTRSSDYGGSLATQTVNTGFGKNTAADGASANGSELDAAYGTIQDGNLYLFLAGNLETNFNHLNLFIDSGQGGAAQNVLTASNSTGALSAMNGLKFDKGINPNLALDINAGGSPLTGYVDQYDLVGNTASYLGSFTPGGASGAATFANGVQVALDNSNTGGVNGTSGTAADQGAANGVTTGLEVAIPLSLLGNPTSSIHVVADINGGGNSYLSNQFLGGLPSNAGNLGTPNTVDLSSIAGNQFFTVALPEPTALAFFGVAAILMLRRRRQMFMSPL